MKYIIRPYESPKCCERQYLIEPKIVIYGGFSFYYLSYSIITLQMEHSFFRF